jgi:hypothetical protein
MLVYGEDFQSDPDYQGDLTDFWCTQTSRDQGPDGGVLSLSLCSDRERTCYREY